MKKSKEIIGLFLKKSKEIIPRNLKKSKEIIGTRGGWERKNRGLFGCNL
jgi:hypothetical protein